MVRMMMVPFAIVFAVIQIFGPFVTQLLARGERARLEAVLRTSTRWAVLLTVPVLALLAIDGGRVLTLLHQRSSAGGPAVIILAVAFMIDALTGLAGHVLTMSGRSGVNAVNSAVALVGNVGLNLVLIPRWGILGAALSWSVVIVGVNVARMIEVRVLFRIGPLSRSLLRPMAAVGLATGMTFAVRIAIHGMVGVLVSVVLDGCVLLAVYAGAVAFYGHREDRMLIRTILRRPARVLQGATR
jgi:O-antigen/teichoic acid export membrane protein